MARFEEVYNYKQADETAVNRIQSLEEKVDLEAGYTTVADNIAGRVDAITNQQGTGAVDTRLAELQSQIDGAISTFFGSGAPTPATEPASLWVDDETKNVHLGDLYYNTDNGYCYRFMSENNEGTTVYNWTLIKDSDITSALSDIASLRTAVETTLPGRIAEKVDIAQGVSSAGHHLFVGEDGNVSAGIPKALYLADASGEHVFVLTIGANGALVVSEQVSE